MAGHRSRRRRQSHRRIRDDSDEEEEEEEEEAEGHEEEDYEQLAKFGASSTNSQCVRHVTDFNSGGEPGEFAGRQGRTPRTHVIDIKNRYCGLTGKQYDRGPSSSIEKMKAKLVPLRDISTVVMPTMDCTLFRGHLWDRLECSADGHQLFERYQGQKFREIWLCDKEDLDYPTLDTPQSFPAIAADQIQEDDDVEMSELQSGLTGLSAGGDVGPQTNELYRTPNPKVHTSEPSDTQILSAQQATLLKDDVMYSDSTPENLAVDDARQRLAPSLSPVPSVPDLVQSQRNLEGVNIESEEEIESDEEFQIVSVIRAVENQTPIPLPRGFKTRQFHSFIINDDSDDDDIDMIM